MNYSSKLMLAVLAACIVLAAHRVGAQDTSSALYMNPAHSPQERAADLVHRMTLEEKASQLVNQARAIPRLRVTAYDWWSEALHGVAVDGTTEFPEPIGLAAAFDAPRIHEMATQPTRSCGTARSTFAGSKRRRGDDVRAPRYLWIASGRFT